MAAYAAAAGLNPLIFIPNGNISYGKLAQALEYGARTFQVEANFDQILALVRVLAERLGIYLLNSINPFRIEGQKTIMIEMLDQRDWAVPDWVVLPGGNLGNISAFGKGLRELYSAGFIDRLPRLAVVQAEDLRRFTNSCAEAAIFAPCIIRRPWLRQSRSATRCRGRRRSSRSWPPTVSSRRLPSRRLPMPKPLSGMRHWLRAGFGGNVSRIAEAPCVGGYREECGCCGGAHRQRTERPGLHLSVSYRRIGCSWRMRLNSTFANTPVVVANDPDEIARLIG